MGQTYHPATLDDTPTPRHPAAMLTNSPLAYGAVAKTFHWLMALGIIAMLAVGFIMVALPLTPFKFQVYGWHKSLGLTLLALGLLRYLWAFTNPTPMLPPGMPAWQRWAAYLTHGALYLCIFLMPLTGWLMSSAAGFPVEVWGLFTVPNLVPAADETRRLYADLHEILAWALIALIPAHVGAALFHHVIKKDNTLRRMLPSVVSRILPVLALILLPLTSQAQSWTVNPAKSSLNWQAKWGGTAVNGIFKSWKPEIVFDPANLAASSIKVTVDLASVDSAYPERDEALKGAEWFNTGAMPTAVFTSSKITATNVKNGANAAPSYVAAGTLTLGGVTKPLALPFTLTITKGADGKQHAQAASRFALSRQAFNIGTGEWKDNGTIKDRVDMNITIVATAP